MKYPSTGKQKHIKREDENWGTSDFHLLGTWSPKCPLKVEDPQIYIYIYILEPIIGNI